MVDPYASNTLSHDHEFIAESDDCIDIDYEYITVREPCTWVEITGSAHSERLDETFYDEGASCEAARYTCYECVNVIGAKTVDTFTEVVKEVANERTGELRETALDAALGGEPDDAITLTHQYEGETYKLVYEMCDHGIEGEGDFS